VGFLRGLGYSVQEVENGEHALEIAESANTPIQVLITDIVMPKMGGRNLADKLISKFPDTRVLYTSGYTYDGAVQTRVLSEGVPAKAIRPIRVEQETSRGAKEGTFHGDAERGCA
jgi:CheY-like chemotaxis protein